MITWSDQVKELEALGIKVVEYYDGTTTFYLKNNVSIDFYNIDTGLFFQYGIHEIGRLLINDINRLMPIVKEANEASVQAIKDFFE